MSRTVGLENGQDSNGDAASVVRDLPINQIRGLASKKISRIFQRGSVVFEEGQQPRGLYMLGEGSAKVSIDSPDGKILVLRIAEPGDLLGVDAALTGQPYETTVETLERCRIDFISSEDLSKLLQRDRKACLAVAHALSQELRGVVEHARLLLLSQSAAEKLARLLIRWCDQKGKRTADGIRINLGLTHEEIAQMIGSSRETVTRLLGELKRKQIVSLVDKAILVRNRKALELAGRC